MDGWLYGERMTPPNTPAQPVIRLTLSLHPEIVDRLRELASEQRITVSEALRRGAAMWIASENPTTEEDKT